jgi:hypothetical protein
MTERAAVRFGVPALSLASAVGALAVSLHTAPTEIPSFAFGSHVVLAVQVALLFFYAAMLLLVPVVRALVDGDLPIELSLKGARWKEGVDDLSENVFDRQTKAEEKALKEGLRVHQEIEELRVVLKEVRAAQDENADETLDRPAERDQPVKTEE